MTLPVHIPALSGRSRLLLAGLSAVACVGALITPSLVSATESSGAEARMVKATMGDVIPGAYIVKTKEGTGARAADQTRRIALSAVERAKDLGAEIRHTYENVGGYAAQLSPEQLAQVRSDANVEFVEEISRKTLYQMTGDKPETRGSQNNATWGIDRSDQRSLPLDNKFTYKATGKGVQVIIMDTGVNTKHTEFTGRLKVSLGWSKVDKKQTNDPEDCQGHGSHVAGTAAGTTYGLAKEADIIGLRIFNCKAENEDDDTLAAMDWTLKNARLPAVVNMSFGEPKKAGGSASDRAVQQLMAKGINVVIAAGNDTKDACTFSPAYLPEAITVGATDRSDNASSFSNYGTCVDINAPGSDIVSAKHGSSTGSKTNSGTSMACPHVTGGVAQYLEARPTSTQAETQQAIVAAASTGRIKGLKGSTPNTLLYTADFPAGSGMPNPQPSQPAPQPTQPAPWPSQPAPQPSQPAPWPTQPAPKPTQPAPWPTQPAPKPTQPAPWPTQPAPQPSQPAPQPSQPAPWPGQPAPQPTRPKPSWPGMPGLPGQP